MMNPSIDYNEIMRQRLLNPYANVVSLADVLGQEQVRQEKLREIRVKYGRPEPPQKLKPKNPTQWMGDNRG